MNRNFEKFEVDHWYVYTGTESGSVWSPAMDFVLNHKARKCTYSPGKTYADFSDACRSFAWGDEFDNWIEVEDPNKTHDILKGEPFYERVENRIAYLSIHHSNVISDTEYYKLSRPPFKESKKEETKVEKKKEFTPEKVKLSPNDDIWIDCARPEELPCDCYVWDNPNHTLFTLTEGHIKSVKMISEENKYITMCRWDFAVPVARVKEALKFVSNVKISDLKKGVKVKIKDDAEWMDRGTAPLERGNIYTVCGTDIVGWGVWNDNLPFKVLGGVSFIEDDAHRYPIHWIEKIVDEKEEQDFGINIHRSSSKIKISDLKKMFGVAIKVNSNEDRIKLMIAVGKKWESNKDVSNNQPTRYPCVIYLNSSGCTWDILENMFTHCKEILWGDIDFEEDKVYIEGTDFYIGEKVRVKKLEDIKENKLWPPEMRAFCEKDVSIQSVSICGITLIDDGGKHGWHTDWFEHISEKNDVKSLTKELIKATGIPSEYYEGSSVNTGAAVGVMDSNGKPHFVKIGEITSMCFTEARVSKKSKYIKLNKKPIKKIKEYRVHKREYIALNK